MLGGAKQDFAPLNRDTFFVEEAINDRARQTRGRERVGQKPDLRALANARKRERGFEWVRSVFFPGDRHGKGVARLAALIGRRNLAIQKFVASRPDQPLQRQGKSGLRLVLVLKPSPLTHVSRQDVPLQ